MNQIAVILGGRFLYWSSVILFLAAAAAACLFLALSIRDRENPAATALAVPLAAVLSLVLARLVHWHCRPEVYSGFFPALTNYSRGGYALIGVFFGCLLAAVTLRLLHLTGNLPRMLDHMALAGCLGISAGRLGAIFGNADRGVILPETVGFPWAAEITNGVSGQVENRLAVFFLQSMATGLLFAGLMVFYIRRRKKLRDGDTCLIFLLCYCACQVVLDSPRYDNLYFRSNGFVSIVQIFGILTVLAVAVIFTLRLARNRGPRWSCMCFLLLPLFGGAGYMEYYVQRHGDQAALAYAIMGVCMALAVGRILLMRAFAEGLSLDRKSPAGGRYTTPQKIMEK